MSCTGRYERVDRRRQLELAAQLVAGVVETTSDRPRRDTHRDRDLRRLELFPRRKSQELAIVIAQARQRRPHIGIDRAVVGHDAMHDAQLGAEPLVKAIAPLTTPPVVGHHLPCDTEQPRPHGRAVRNLPDPPPSDREHLGDDVGASGGKGTRRAT